MFIYEYMVGIVEYIAGGDSDDYDPHMHRKVERPTTYVDTLVHLLKGSIGAGVLAMPQAMARTGLIVGIPGLIAIGFFATYCIHLLIDAEYEVCRRLRVGYLSYGHSAEQAALWGPSCMKWISKVMPFIIDVSLVYFQLGLGVVYPVFICENTKQILEYHGIHLSVRLLMLCLLPFLILISLIKDLKMLVPVSTISNIVTMFAFFLVFFYLIEEDVEITSKHLEFKSPIGLPNFVGITLFALEAVGVILALEYNMDRPKKFARCCGLFDIGMIIIIVLYMLIGVFGYIKYGDNIKPSITLNLPYTDKKAQTCKGAMALAIFLSFPLQIFVGYQILWDKWRVRFAHHKSLVFEDYVFRVVCTILPWLIGYLFPFLENLISLIGGVAISVLAFIVPPFMDICIVWSQQEWPKPRRSRQREVIDVLVTKSDPHVAATATSENAKTAAATAAVVAAAKASKADRLQSASNKPLPFISDLRIVGDILLILAGILALTSIIVTCIL